MCIYSCFLHRRSQQCVSHRWRAKHGQHDPQGGDTFERRAELPCILTLLSSVHVHKGGGRGPAETAADEMARTALEMPEIFLASRTKNSAEARNRLSLLQVYACSTHQHLYLMTIPVSHRWHQSYSWEELVKDWTLLYCLCASIGHDTAMLLW